jgi:hypothetical protein
VYIFGCIWKYLGDFVFQAPHQSVRAWVQRSQQPTADSGPGPAWPQPLGMYAAGPCFRIQPVDVTRGGGSGRRKWAPRLALDSRQPLWTLESPHWSTGALFAGAGGAGGLAAGRSAGKCQ